MEEGEMTTEDIATNADNKVDALIKLLLKKKMITEDEFEKEYMDLFEEDEEPGKEE